MSMDEDTMNEMRGQMTDIMTGNTELADSKEVILYDPEDFTLTHKNNFTKEYLDYIEAIDPAICGSVGYTRMVGMNLLRLDAGEAKPASMTIGISSGKEHAGSMTSMNEVGLATYPENLDGSSDSYLQKKLRSARRGLPVRRDRPRAGGGQSEPGGSQRIPQPRL